MNQTSPRDLINITYTLQCHFIGSQRGKARVCLAAPRRTDLTVCADQPPAGNKQCDVFLLYGGQHAVGYLTFNAQSTGTAVSGGGVGGGGGGAEYHGRGGGGTAVSGRDIRIREGQPYQGGDSRIREGQPDQGGTAELVGCRTDRQPRTRFPDATFMGSFFP